MPYKIDLRMNMFSDAMPYYHSKSLDNCMDYYFRECQPTPHSALEDAKCVKRLCENYARNQLRYEDFDDFLCNHQQYLHTF